MRVFPRLKTDRLILDEISEKDIDDLFAIFGDHATMETYDMPPYNNVKDVLEIININRRRYEAGTGIRWGVKLGQKLIGTCGYVVYKEGLRGLISYEINYKYWRCGFATEAVNRIIAYGFSNLLLHRIEAYVTENNAASERVLGKLGFTKEGTLREVAFFKGAYQTQHLYSKLNSDQ